MKTAHQIVASLLGGIDKLYREPHRVAWTQFGLDGILCQLHSHYAEALDRTDEFVQARWQIFVGDMAAWKSVHQSPHFHRVVDAPADFPPIIDEWRKSDEIFGLRPPA